MLNCLLRPFSLTREILSWDQDLHTWWTLERARFHVGLPRQRFNCLKRCFWNIRACERDYHKIWENKEISIDFFFFFFWRKCSFYSVKKFVVSNLSPKFLVLRLTSTILIAKKKFFQRGIVTRARETDLYQLRKVAIFQSILIKVKF